MDPVAARLECLKLVVSKEPNVLTAKNNPSLPDEVVTAAGKFAEFVIGPKVKEHAGSDKKGADDHLAHKK